MRKISPGTWVANETIHQVQQESKTLWALITRTFTTSRVCIYHIKIFHYLSFNSTHILLNLLIGYAEDNFVSGETRLHHCA